MRTVSMCFSLLQVPRCRFHTLASSWWENFHKLGREGGKVSRLNHLCSNNSDLEGGHTRKYVRTVTTKKDQKRKIALSNKSDVIGHETEYGTTLSSSELHTNKLVISKVEKKDFGTQQKISENKDLAKLTTLIIFDIETTGFSRENERIIEIALQDLVGGENSTFQTLINPECYVPNSHVHGISTHMVSRPDVPRYLWICFDCYLSI